MSALHASELYNVDGLVAVITGGGTGLGLIMARALVDNGAAHVYVIGRRRAKLDEAAALHANITGICGDVTSQAFLQEAADQVRRERGHVHLVVANAGASGPGFLGLSPEASIEEFVAHAWKTPMADITSVFELNYTAVYYTALAFMTLLDAGNRARFKPSVRSQVIVTASTASFLRKIRVGLGYSGSKAAVVSLTKALASMCVPYNIRFNAIAPGLFMSDLATPMMKAYNIPEGQDPTIEGAFPPALNPAQRLGSEKDMAGVFLYMASQAGSFLNGSVNLIDGGALTQLPSTY